MFNWSGRHHGGAEGFWLWVEDNENNRTYHNEYILFSRRNHPEHTSLEVVVPVFDPMPQQYFIRVVSDSWVGCEALIPVSFRHVLVDGLSSPTFFTNLIDLTPLPVQALSDKHYEQLYANRFDVFNPIQTQLFHILYHSDTPVLLGKLHYYNLSLPSLFGESIIFVALIIFSFRFATFRCSYGKWKDDSGRTSTA